jgi:hypothetical protein
MFKDFKRLVYVCMAFVMAMVFSACGGGGGGGVAGSGTTGTLSLGLTDVPGDYLNVFVTIDEVQVNHETEGWETLTGLNLPQTFDLMTLQNGVIAPLGAVDIEAGHYNQMRLILSSDPGANYLVIEGEEGEPDEEVDLKVPSGLQTGIKIVQGFDIEVAGSTELTLDFNAEKSIVQAGKSGKWLLKPTIKVLETITFSVSGVVTDDAFSPLNGASVSNQVYDDSQADPKDEITVLSGTESAPVDVLEDGNIVEGFYKMYLPITQNTFNIVATMDGYMPDCRVLTGGVAAYEDFDFTLVPAAATGTFKGSMTELEGFDAADSALFSIRQLHGSCEVIEVASASVVKTEAFNPAVYFDPITLPVGDYEVVVSGDGEVTQVWNIEITDGGETVLDIVFPTSTVEGIVDDGTNPLDGASISVQAYDPFAADAKDEVVEVLTTETDVTGAYFTYLPAGQSDYSIVATLAGYIPACDVATTGIINTIDFTLTEPAAGTTGTISGSVSGMAPAESATVSIRQASCGSIEIDSFSVLNDGAFGPIALPAGITYEVVVSAAGYVTQNPSAFVDVGLDTPVNVLLVVP